MKKQAKYMCIVAIIALTSCTSSKQVIPVHSEQAKKSYKLPACHKAVHEELLRNQQKFIHTAVKLNFTDVKNRKERKE